MGERRDAKKQETRQRISDTATALFLTRGFDAVTIDEVATTAGVARMTVFNYFPRKEDLFLDRQDDLKMTLLCDAVRSRAPGNSPVDVLRALMKELRLQNHPFARVDRETVEWWRFVTESPALRARLRELLDSGAEALALELGGPIPDGRARLAASIVVLTIQTAREESVRAADRGVSGAHLADAFFAVFDHGFDAVERVL